MPSTESVDCTIFRHLTGRAEPRIQHPTSNSFDFAEWLAVLPDDYSDRDDTLIRTALTVNQQVRALRDHHISKAFEGISRAELVALGIACANRAFLLIREKSRAAVAEFRSKSEVAHLSALSQLTITAFEGADPQAGPDLNTAVIDSLPQWFAAAARMPDDGDGAEPDFSIAGAAGEMLLSLENVFRDVWQEVLWEPWKFESFTDEVRVTPALPDDQAMWRVWDWREESLLHQRVLFNRHLERRYTNASMAQPISTTVRAFTHGESPVIEFDEPSPEQGMIHRATMELLDDAYVAIFLHDNLNGVGVTPHLLALASLVLQDLLHAALPNDPDPEVFDRSWISRMSCRLPRASIVSTLATALGISAELADALTKSLTSDPWGPLTTLFIQGVWHRPLIACGDGEHLMMVAGVLVWGSSLRAVERWLQIGKGTDLTKTKNGLRFERAVRASAAGALAENAILRPVSSKVAAVPKGKDREEIDLLVRIGRTLVVAEIKCLLGPSDPIDRYDYLRKLQDAAEQARRKAAWLADHPDATAEFLSEPKTPDLRHLPLVIVNQSNGAGWSFDGCSVIDAHLFNLFLSGGEYHSSAAFPLDGQADASFKRSVLYTSAEEAEAAMPSVFIEHPGLTLFREALDWTATTVPLADGRPLRMAYPIMNGERYIANFPIPDDLKQPEPDRSRDRS